MELRLKNKGFGFRKIKEILGTKIRISTLYFWFNGRIPLPFKEFSTIKKEFDKNDLKQIALIIGHVFGDGGISEKKFLHYCNTEDFLIDEFQNAIKNVFNFNPSYKYKEDMGITRLRYSRLTSRILLSLFGEFSLGKDNKKITPQIEKMPMWWKKILLRAWYNDDGSISYSEKYRSISFKQKDKNLILWIQKILMELNIKSKIDKDGNNKWHLRILNYLDMVKFSNKIGFSKGYRKQTHLEKIIKKVVSPHWKTKIEIIKLLKKKPRTIKELAKYLDIETGTIHGHLDGWKRSEKSKRKSTPGLVDMSLVKIKKSGRKIIYFLDEKEYEKFSKILDLEKMFETTTSI